MTSRVQYGLTAGVAMVGASVIAVTPMVAPTPPRIAEAAVAMMADFTGLDQQQLIQLTAERFVEQLGQVPLAPLLAAADLVGGDNARLYTVLRSVIDSPVYVADPLIEAVANTVPVGFGGGSDHKTTQTSGDGTIMAFRNDQLLGLRDSLDGAVADVLNVDASIDANTAYGISTGIQKSVDRTVKGLGLAPLGLVDIAEAIATGSNADLYMAIRQYLDAPLWTADPTITALEKALPVSLGGATEFGDDQQPTNGGLKDFRDQTLWGATHKVRVAVADALNVELTPQDNPVEPNTTSARVAATDEGSISDASDTKKLDVTKLKPHFTNLNTPLKQANGNVEKQLKQANANAEKSIKKVQANVNKALDKVKDAVDNATKNLKPKTKTTDKSTGGAED